MASELFHQTVEVFLVLVLIVRSGFIPRVLGILVMMAGVGYLMETTASVLLPQYADALFDIAGLLELGEPPIILWLLIWGARAHRPKFPCVIASIASGAQGARSASRCFIDAASHSGRSRSRVIQQRAYSPSSSDHLS